MTAPNAPSGNLGQARGSIQIDTSQLRSVAAVATQVGQQTARGLGQIDIAARRAQASLTGMGGIFSQMAGATGVSLGAAGLVALGRQAAQTAIELDALATSYKRQEVAAVSLAGGTGKLTELLRAYEKATGGAVDKATALAQVSRLQAVGFADSAEELTRIVTIARGAALAMGSTQEYILSQLQLALANQTTARLDQIGIGIEEFQARLAHVQATQSGLSKEMAFQVALLGALEDKYSGLASSAAAQATGVERATVAWKNLRLEMGKVIGPGANVVGMFLAARITQEIEKLNAWVQAINRVARAMGLLSMSVPQFNTIGISSSGSIGGSGAQRRAAAELTPLDKEKINYADAIADIERSASTARLDAIRDYEQQATDIVRQGGQQRAATIRQYEQTIAREAEDFARNRVRQWADLEQDIARINRDRARQEAQMHESRVRQEGEWRADLDERIGDLRGDSAKRIADIEEDAAKERERAARDHRERLLGAAARLDAVAVLAEQRRFATERADKEADLKERVNDEKEQLAESISEANEAHEERLEDAREADDRRLEDMREADEQRIEDMRQALAEQQQEEDEDRALRLERMEQDHNDQLAEQARTQAEQLAQLATQHAERMEQIDQHAFEERKAEEKAHLLALAELGVYNQGWKAIQDARQKEALLAWDAWWREINKRFQLQGPRPQGSFPSLNDPYTWTPQANMVPPQFPLSGSVGSDGRMGRSVIVQSGAVTVYAAPGQSALEIAEMVDERLMLRFTEFAGEQ